MNKKYASDPHYPSYNTAQRLSWHLINRLMAYCTSHNSHDGAIYSIYAAKCGDPQQSISKEMGYNEWCYIYLWAPFADANLFLVFRIRKTYGAMVILHLGYRRILDRVEKSQIRPGLL